MPSTAPGPGRRAFAALLRRPEGEIDLVRAALLIAGDAYPDLDAGACQALLDGWAEQVRARLPDGPDAALRHPQIAVQALNAVLFAEAGFHGNTAEYYDPRNSYLNEVLARRMGIPITLALVYIAVARRAGLPMHGVGLPGHFLVGYTPPATLPGQAGTLFIDPFHGGQQRTLAECATLFHAVVGPQAPFTPRLLAPVTPHQFLARLLTNLKGIYLERHDWPQALRIVDYLLLVQPHALDDLRLRGLLYYRLGAFVPALSDLKHYLHAAPAAEDATQIRYYITLLQHLLASGN